MSCFRSARLLFDLLAVPVSPYLHRPLSSLRSSISTLRSAPLATTSRVLDHGAFSSRPFRLHVRTVDVSLIHVVLWRKCLTRNLTCSVLTMLFATKNADVFSTSMGYVDLQRSLLIEILMISSTWQSSPRTDLTVPSSSPCAMASTRVSRTRLHFPSTTLSLVKWSLWPHSVPLCCLFPKYTDTRLRRTTQRKPSIYSWNSSEAAR